jgi:hypothetical protein
MSVYTDLFSVSRALRQPLQRELRAKYKGSLLGVDGLSRYPSLLMGVYTGRFPVLWRAQPGIR